ncbi:54-like peptide receptor [Argonauta hians]
MAEEYKMFSDTWTNISNRNNSESDEYTYDYHESISNLPLFELVPVAIMYGLTLILGVIGNSLVIFSIAHYRRMRTLTNIFLLSLASADLFLIVLCVPIKFASFFTFTWQFGEFLCKAVYYLQNVSAICSVTTLTVMSVERYYAIIYPIKAKYVCTVKRAKIAIFFIWILSFLLASPIIFGRNHEEVGEIRKVYWCIENWSSQTLDKIYEFYMMSIILLIPVTVMSFAYTSICKELWIVGNTRTAMTNGQNDSGLPQGTKVSETDPFNKSRIKMKTITSKEDQTRKQVIKMLVLIIVLFVICWAPILTNNLLVAYGYLPLLNLGYLKPMREAFFLMAYSNSCVNPVVYGFMSKNFRETFYNAVCSCVRGKEYVRRKQFERHNSCATRSTQMGYIREIEMEDMEMCSKYGATDIPEDV